MVAWPDWRCANRIRYRVDNGWYAMSVLGYILSFVFFVVSFTGLAVLLAGLMFYIVSPMVYRLTGVGQWLANLPLWLVGAVLSRGAIVVSEHNSLMLKKMKEDGLGVERIKIDGERKEFEDPDKSLHNFLGMRFAFADERHGVLFDPRHAAAGRRKNDADTKGEGLVPATDGEWKSENVTEWVRGLFEFPEGVHELVDLSDVRHLVDGGERAENPRQTEEIYKHSREVFGGGTPAKKFLYPLAGMILPFILIWLLSTQLGTDTASVGFGSVLWLALGGSGGLLGIDWKHALKVAALSLVGGLVLFLVFLVYGSFGTGLIIATFVLGYLLVPLIAMLSAPSHRLASAISGLLLTQGLFGYDRPVIEWTPRGYTLRRFSDLDDAKEVKWYSFAGSMIGVTFEPTAESWDAEHMATDELTERRMEHVGDASDSNIPTGHVPYNLRARGGRGAFGPRNLRDGFYYLHSGILLQRFEDSAVGTKSMNRLTDSKEKHGESDGGLSDKSVLYSTVAASFMSMGMSIVVFFL